MFGMNDGLNEKGTFVEGLEKELYKVFNGFFGVIPKVWNEQKREYYYELPGVKKSDVTIEAVGKELKITAQINKYNTKHTYTDTLRFTSDITDKNVSSKLEDGILTVSILTPAPEAPRSFKVNIN